LFNSAQFGAFHAAAIHKSRLGYGDPLGGELVTGLGFRTP
jgi:hypothetical protein